MLSAAPPPLPPVRPKWQFSLRTLMIGMTGFAFLCGILAVMPGAFFYVLIGLAWFAVSGWLATGLIFARGDQRAFCIGAAIVFLSTWTRIGGGFLGQIVDVVEWFTTVLGLPRFDIYVEAGLKYVILIPLAVANGYMCIYARRYFEQHAEEGK